MKSLFFVVIVLFSLNLWAVDAAKAPAKAVSVAPVAQPPPAAKKLALPPPPAPACASCVVCDECGQWYKSTWGIVGIVVGALAVGYGAQSVLSPK